MQLQDIHVVFEKSMGAGVVIIGSRGMATGGYATWYLLECRQVDSLNPLVPSSLHYLL